MHTRIYFALVVLIAFGGLHCGAPTGGEDNPELAVTPAILDFGEVNTSLILTISNIGSGTLHWSVEVPSEGWISIGQREGNITNEPVGVDVSIDREVAPVGAQEVTLIVTAEQGGRKEITLKATIRRVAKLSLSPTALDFGETSNQQQVTVRNDGGESLIWNAVSSQTWISIVPDSGALTPGNQQTVTVSIDRAGQTPGSIQGTVDVTSSGGSVSVIVQAIVPNLPIASVSPTVLDFGTVQDRLSVELSNIGAAILDWTLVVSDAWIRPATTSGSVLVGASTRVYIEITREGLEVGAHQGRITFRSVGGDVEVAIYMRISTEPILGLSEESLEVETATLFAFSIRNAGSGDLHWDITENEDWLALDPISGTTATVPKTISGVIQREGLVAGGYAANIRIESDGGSKDLALTMQVSLPSVEITSGPDEGEELGTDQVTFAFRARDAYGDTAFSTKLNDGDWSAWSDVTEVTYGNLEESALVGTHLFQVRVRSDAGEAEPFLRSFEIDAVQGPALRLSPKVLTTSAGEDIAIDVVAEEVELMLAARVVLNFDADKLELQRVEGLETFLTQDGGSIVQPDAEIDNANGTLDLSIGVAGGTQAGISGTGALARLYFRAKSSGVAQILFGSETTVRDPDNQPVSVNTQGSTVTIQ